MDNWAPRQLPPGQLFSGASCSGSPRQPSRSRPPSRCTGQPEEYVSESFQLKTTNTLFTIHVTPSAWTLLVCRQPKFLHARPLFCQEKSLLGQWEGQMKNGLFLEKCTKKDLSNAPPRKDPATGMMSDPVFFPFPPKPSVLWAVSYNVNPSTTRNLKKKCFSLIQNKNKASYVLSVEARPWPNLLQQLLDHVAWTSV